MRKKPIKKLAAKGQVDEFWISLQNRYSGLTKDDDLCVQAVNDNLSILITESAAEAGRTVARQDTGMFSQEPKDLLKARQKLKASNPRDKIDLEEASKFISA